jgi:1,4-dihydroxy-2-naphthoate octaprenyltransferase
MQKAILSPICSGLVIPGLGQIINQDLKKGILILCAVFALFVAGIVRLLQIIHSVFRSGHTDLSDSQALMARLGAEDSTMLWCLGIAFAILWIYAVVDAYRGGRKVDQLEAGSLMT